LRPPTSAIRKPIIFISYSHKNEPEKPGRDEKQWLTFVVGFLRAAFPDDGATIWLDRLMPAGRTGTRRSNASCENATCSCCSARAAPEQTFRPPEPPLPEVPDERRSHEKLVAGGYNALYATFREDEARVPDRADWENAVRTLGAAVEPLLKWLVATKDQKRG
jgi:hypothetical protein